MDEEEKKEVKSALSAGAVAFLLAFAVVGVVLLFLFISLGDF